MLSKLRNRNRKVLKVLMGEMINGDDSVKNRVLSLKVVSGLK